MGRDTESSEEMVCGHCGITVKYFVLVTWDRLSHSVLGTYLYYMYFHYKHGMCSSQRLGSYRSVEEKLTHIIIIQRLWLTSSYIFFILFLCTGFWFVNMVVVVLSICNSVNNKNKVKNKILLSLFFCPF